MNENENKKSAKVLKTTPVEKVLYGLGDVGCNMIWTFTGSFLTMYYTDSVGIAAAFIGTMMLVARLLDGVSDIAMGIVIEKTHTRWGKSRPWILFGSIPFVISLFLVFNVPAQFTENGKNIYVFLTYIFMSVICFTAVNMAYHSMLPRISQDAADRGVISTVRTFMTLILSLVLSYATPELLANFGGTESQTAWSTAAAIYGVVGGILLIINFLTIKEKVPMQRDEKGEVKKIPIKDAAKAVIANKYFFLAVIMSICVLAASGLSAANSYYVRDVLGDLSLFGVMSTFSIIPRMVILMLSPMLFKRFGRRTVCLAGCILSIAAGVLMLIEPANTTIFLILIAVRGFSSTPLQVVVFTLASDIVDFGEWKTGIRAEGLATSVTSFGMKIGTGLGSALVGWILAWGGYNASLSVQTQATVSAEIFLVVGVPIILTAIAAVCLFLWDLEKKLPQIRQAIDEKK